VASSGLAVQYTLEQIDLIHRMVAQYPADFAFARTRAEIEAARRSGRIAGLIGIENGEAIEDSLALLRMYSRLGAAYMTLTHADTTEWCDSATDTPRHGGLSRFGEDVVREMNRLGMLVDISHVSPEAMRHVQRVSRAPVVATHSGAFGVAAHPRNVPDDVLARMRANGGLVMVNFASSFLTPAAVEITHRMFDVYRDLHARFPDPTAYEQAVSQWRRANPVPPGTVQDLVKHIDHIVELAGVDHAGLGSDYDGVVVLPAGLEDVSGYPLITQALLERGYGRDDILKILGGNMLRVLEAAQAAATP
jgi:membrane dipeptidase